VLRVGANATTAARSDVLGDRRPVQNPDIRELSLARGFTGSLFSRPQSAARTRFDDSKLRGHRSAQHSSRTSQPFCLSSASRLRWGLRRSTRSSTCLCSFPTRRDPSLITAHGPRPSAFRCISLGPWCLSFLGYSRRPVRCSCIAGRSPSSLLISARSCTSHWFSSSSYR